MSSSGWYTPHYNLRHFFYTGAVISQCIPISQCTSISQCTLCKSRLRRVLSFDVYETDVQIVAICGGFLLDFVI